MSDTVVVVKDTTIEFVEIVVGGPQGPAGPGIPTGGAVGDILQKTGSGNYVTGWTDQPIVDKLRFDEVAAETVTTAEMAWDGANRTMKIGTSPATELQVGQELHYPLCRNLHSTTIYKGQPVMLDPAGVATGDHFNIVPMNASGLYPRYVFLGVAYENIEAGELGLISAFGRVDGVALGNVKPVAQTWTAGEILWCHPSVPGQLTDTMPIAPAHAIPVAVVIQVSGGNCKLIVRTFTP